MKYVEVTFSCIPTIDFVSDIVSAELAEISFESFIPTDSGFIGYLPEKFFSKEKLDNLIANLWLDVKIDYTWKTLPDKNWNEVWEKHFFEPIVVNAQCIVCSSFHQMEDDYPYSIIIDPKMAFGTGHHQTTYLMLHEILAMNLAQKTVLDIGCGTAVLAILASMRGAKSLVAIDIEEWAYRNALENVAMNDVSHITVLHGDVHLVENQKFDLVLANINRNVLLLDIPHYKKILCHNGQVVMSGFYKDDIPIIREKCDRCGLTFQHFREKDNWVVMVFRLD